MVCGPDTIAEHDGADQVVACALLPFGVRFPEPLPAGVLDYGVLWPGQSDVFVPLDLPTPDTVAWLMPDDARTQATLLEDAAGAGYQPGRAAADRRAPRGRATACRRSSGRWCAAAPWCCCAVPEQTRGPLAPWTSGPTRSYGRD